MNDVADFVQSRWWCAIEMKETAERDAVHVCAERTPDRGQVGGRISRDTVERWSLMISATPLQAPYPNGD